MIRVNAVEGPVPVGTASPVAMDETWDCLAAQLRDSFPDRGGHVLQEIQISPDGPIAKLTWSGPPFAWDGRALVRRTGTSWDGQIEQATGATLIRVGFTTGMVSIQATNVWEMVDGSPVQVWDPVGGKL